MVEEGLLSPKHAEEFLEIITDDVNNIESQRNKMYRLVNLQIYFN